MKKLLGEKAIGILLYYFNPELRASWGGPFNAQEFRQQIFLEIIDKIKFAFIAETGTFRGTTTEFLSSKSGLAVYTSEISPRFYSYSKARFLFNGKIKPYEGDSRAFLKKVLSNSLTSNPAFFYLDAHWKDDLPLKEEVEIIFSRCPQAVIMIDDFKVPFDSGYTYDNYGDGKELSLEYLAPIKHLNFSAFFPAGSSVQETGYKRGSVVLAKDNDMITKLTECKTLKLYKIS
ncbi:MAG TPA: hypothetical protein VHO28_11400 [Ignavibacteriales bacterium]|nr:hypothetical protein [Ignavibacteriales bacterium]